MKSIEHEYTDEIVCPWCGCKFSDSWEWSDYDDEVVCDDCGGEFSYERHVEVTYSTEKAKCPNRGCKMECVSHYGKNKPYIYDNRNWTIWKCKICDHEIIKVSKIVGDEPRIELLTSFDF